MGGFASSRILEVHGERMIKRTFDPGFRIELHQKISQSCPVGRAQPGSFAAEYGQCAAAIFIVCGAWRQRLGPSRHG